MNIDKNQRRERFTSFAASSMIVDQSTPEKLIGDGEELEKKKHPKKTDVRSTVLDSLGQYLNINQIRNLEEKVFRPANIADDLLSSRNSLIA